MTKPAEPERVGGLVAAPRLVERLVDTRQVTHSTMAIQELMHTVGVLDPADPRTPGVVQAVCGQIETMLEHRVFAPDAVPAPTGFHVHA